MLIKGVDQRNTMYNGRHISSDIFEYFRHTEFHGYAIGKKTVRIVL